jgi:type IV pilus assembly protein PilB
MPTQVAQDRLGDHLVSEGLITELQLREALTDARDHNTRVGFALVKLGFLAEEEITRMLARQYRVPAVDLDRVTVEEKIARLIPGEVAFKHLVLPLRRVGRTLTVAMANPSDLGAIDDVKFITRLEVEPVVVGESRSTTTRPTTGWRRSSAT